MMVRQMFNFTVIRELIVRVRRFTHALHGENSGSVAQRLIFNAVRYQKRGSQLLRCATNGSSKTVSKTKDPSFLGDGSFVF